MLPLIPILTALITGKEFVKAVEGHISEGTEVSSVTPQSLPAPGHETSIPPRA